MSTERKKEEQILQNILDDEDDIMREEPQPDQISDNHFEAVIH